MSSITNINSWSVLTAFVNEIREPNTAIRDLLFSDEETLTVETIEIQTVSKSREMAPFVRKNGEALMVGGYTTAVGTVQAPNIRLKKPYVPSDVFLRRTGLGSLQVYANQNANQPLQDFEAHIQRELSIINGMIDNSEEWMCCQALQGSIAYSVNEQEVFTITYPKPAANNITLSDSGNQKFWDNADPTVTRPLSNFLMAKRVAAEYGVTLTDAILGSEASSNLFNIIEKGAMPTLANVNQVTAGSATLIEDFQAKGILYLGNLGGLRCWEYARTVLLNGVSQNLIRPKWIEFVSRNSVECVRSLKFGAIADWTALRGGKLASRRFAKQWEQEDPSNLFNLVHGRPLPMIGRPGTNVSMKVVSG